MIARQIGARRPHRVEQRQHVLQGPGLGGSRLGTRQRAAGRGRVEAEPGPQAVPQAEHLAMAGSGRERHGVQVVDDDALPRLAGIGSVLVDPQTGRGHLGELGKRRRGPPTFGMSVLLELHGQRAAPLQPHRHAEPVSGVEQRRLRQAPPIDARIAAGPGALAEISVLHIEERPHHDRRDALEAPERRRSGAGVVDDPAVRAGDPETGERPFPVGREEPGSSGQGQGGAEARLLDHPVALVRQAPLESGNPGVAAADVEGAVPREDDAGARARAHGVGEPRGDEGEEPRLHHRAPELEGDRRDEEPRENREPEKALDPGRERDAATQVLAQMPGHATHGAGRQSQTMETSHTHDGIARTGGNRFDARNAARFASRRERRASCSPLRGGRRGGGLPSAGVPRPLAGSHLVT